MDPFGGSAFVWELCGFAQKGTLYDDSSQKTHSKTPALEWREWWRTHHGQLLHSCLVHSAAPLGHSAQLYTLKSSEGMPVICSSNVWSGNFGWALTGFGGVEIIQNINKFKILQQHLLINLFFNVLQSMNLSFLH